MKRSSDKKRRKKKRSKAKRDGLNCLTSDTSDGEDVDISEEMHPIGHFINDRKIMIEELFSVMTDDKLNSMIPPALKEMTVNELKEHCLSELQCMTENEINSILKGDKLSVQNKHQSDINPVKMEVITLSSSESSVSSSSSSGSSSPVSIRKENDNVNGNKTLLDILEQEMQAIAYRTVLKKDKLGLFPENQEDSGAKKLQNEAAASSVTSQISTDLPVITNSTGNGSSFTEDVPVLMHIKEEITECTQLESFECPNVGSISEQIQIKTEALDSSDNDKVMKSPNAAENPKNLEKSEVNNVPSVDINPDDSTLILSMPATVGSKENFMVKVYSNRNDSPERVVQKVFSSSLINNPPHESSNDETSISKFVDSTKHDDNQVSTSNDGVNNTRDIQEKQQCEPSIITLHNSTTQSSKENPDVDPDHEIEKEEGELTTDESDGDVEVVEVVKDKHRSPTVSLSSGEETGKSNSPATDRCRKRRKHKHKRHRKILSREESPINPDCCIETRGTRSYRRKDKSSPQSVQDDNDNDPKIVTPESSPKEESKDEPQVHQSTNLQVEGISDKTQKDHDSSDSENSSMNDAPSKNDPLSEPEIPDKNEEPDHSKTSWAERWAKSKNVRKVVTTSKIYRTVKKKIILAKKEQKAAKVKKMETPAAPPVPPLILQVEGSVQEYSMLPCSTNDNKAPEENNKGNEETESHPM